MVKVEIGRFYTFTSPVLHSIEPAVVEDEDGVVTFWATSPPCDGLPCVRGMPQKLPKPAVLDEEEVQKLCEYIAKLWPEVQADQAAYLADPREKWLGQNWSWPVCPAIYRIRLALNGWNFVCAVDD